MFLDSCSTDYIHHIGSALASLSPCSIPQRIYRQAQNLLRSFLPWSGISSKSGIEYSRTMWGLRSEQCRVSLTHPPLMRSPLSTRKCVIHFLLSNNYVLFIRWKMLICLGHIRCLGCWRLISTLSGLEQCIILVHFIYIL